MTPEQLAFRVRYELWNRAGLEERLRPVVEEPAKIQEHPTNKEWWAGLRDDHWFKRIRGDIRGGTAGQVIGRLLSESDQNELIERADKALEGKIRCYSRWTADYGNPVDWHRNPSKGVSWPADRHWSRIYEFGAQGGDIKDIWELNRFPHLYDWCRAYALNNESRWPRAFAQQLKSWEEANPYRGGANWASGQELAIRLLSWCFAVAAFGDDEAFTTPDFERFLGLTYRHAVHIEEQIDFARLASHNNHLIGEALALYAVGTLFPFFNEAERWKNLGRRLLLEDSLSQFYVDGGYCQPSPTYQRLALHYLLWAYQLMPDDDPGRAELRSTMERSGKFLASMICDETGMLPNRGANDGALFTPWTACDYTDFRPLLSALRYATTKTKAFDEGKWDEESFWFFGSRALDSDISAFERDRTSFSTTGVHILRRGQCDFATFRCGTLQDRFAQADQLHVDIFWKGLNIAQDGGSYRYNQELDFHDWFMGTSSHNTVSVDGRDQMLRVRRFKWLNMPTARAWPCGEDAIRGFHDGYKDRGVMHHRTLRMVDDGWDIVDDIEVEGVEKNLALHWLLCDGSHSVEQIGDDVFQLEIETAKGVVELLLTYESTGADDKSEMLVEFDIERAKEPPEPKGWISRYYGERAPALSAILSLTVSHDVRLTSSFRFSPGLEVETDQ